MKVKDLVFTHKYSLAAIIGVLLIAILPLSGLDNHTPAEHVITIEAERFAFSPGVIRVNEGDKVLIRLVSKDVVHGLDLEGYDLRLTADPGQTAELSFTANKSGSFRYRCSETCGAMHPFMVGKLRVGNNHLIWRGSAAAIFLGFLGVFGLRNEHL